MNENMNSNQVTGYVTLLLFLSVFFMVTTYFNSNSTNISVHINRFIPIEKDDNSLRGGKYWEYHLSKYYERSPYLRHHSKPNIDDSYAPSAVGHRVVDVVDRTIIENSRHSVGNKIETPNRR